MGVFARAELGVAEVTHAINKQEEGSIFRSDLEVWFAEEEDQK